MLKVTKLTRSPSFHSPQSTQGPPSFPGLVSTPGTTQLTAKDILHWLQASKARCTVASEEVIPAVESIVSECPGLKTKFLLSPHSQNRWLSFRELFQTTSAEHSCVETGIQEPMAIYFTSGTTGSPNMVQHSQSSLRIGYTLCGSSIIQPLTTYPIMTLCSAPTVYWMLVLKDLKRCKFKKLPHCLMGGEPLNPEVLEQWKVQTGLMLYEGYGQTGIICANQKGQEIKPGSVGVVKAFVVLSAPFKSSNPEKLTLELQDHVKKSTAPYKYPRKVEFVEELPKMITGKIKRNVLRDHEWG
nr:acyl-coenzyme A synthetase ACSM4, mitochondrial-like [Globicephala melas]